MTHRRLAATLTVLTLALALTAGCSKKKEPTAGAEEAPNFTLPSLTGGTVELASHKGKVVLLDFWATWCPPCRAAIPHLVELQQTFGPQGFQALGLNLDDNPDDLTGFLARSPVNYPILRADEKVRASYGGVSAIPQVFLVDRKGRIRERFQGYTPEIAEKMKASVQTLVQEGS